MPFSLIYITYFDRIENTSIKISSERELKNGAKNEFSPILFPRCHLKLTLLDLMLISSLAKSGFLSLTLPIILFFISLFVLLLSNLSIATFILSAWLNCDDLTKGEPSPSAKFADTSLSSKTKILTSYITRVLLGGGLLGSRPLPFQRNNESVLL